MGHFNWSGEQNACLAVHPIRKNSSTDIFKVQMSGARFYSFARHICVSYEAHLCLRVRALGIVILIHF